MDNKNINKNSKANSNSKNDGTKRSKFTAGLLGIICPQFGFHRLFSGKLDFFIFIILYFLTGGLIAPLVIIDCIIILCMSDKKYQVFCQVKGYKREMKVIFSSKEKLDDLINEWDVEIPQDKAIASSILSTPATITNGYVTSNGINIEVVDKLDEDEDLDEDIDDDIDDDIDEVNTLKEDNIIDDKYHEHIKEDETLSNQINKSQDRLERYKSNDYFPNTNNAVSKKDQLKELKEELKSGLISKEDYIERLKQIR
ncbi:MAG: hypothetical protein MJ245_03035 [Clostridia bacterium]|nr:hypothetical protein [Clostridia bacterium]